jgi:hypothetical protein
MDIFTNIKISPNSSIIAKKDILALMDLLINNKASKFINKILKINLSFTEKKED